MSDVKSLSVVSQQMPIRVPFHGAELYLVNHEGVPVTPMKPIAGGMGLDWRSQHRKLATNSRRWGMVELTMPSAGGAQSMSCMPLRKLPGWLMSIETGKVKDLAVRARVIQYQNECDNVLWEYWSGAESVSHAKLDDLARNCAENVCSHMLWLRAWWEAHGDAMQTLNPNMAASLHDQFVDGAIAARGLARKIGFEFPEEYARRFQWGASSREKLAALIQTAGLH